MPDKFEEYDGLNHEQAKAFIIVVHLPILTRGHSISLQVLDDILALRVPTFYKLQLGLPKTVK